MTWWISAHFQTSEMSQSILERKKFITLLIGFTASCYFIVLLFQYLLFSLFDSLVHGKVFCTFVRILWLPLHFCTYCLLCIRSSSRQLEIISYLFFSLCFVHISYIHWVFLLFYCLEKHAFTSEFFLLLLFYFTVSVFSSDFSAYWNIHVSNSLECTTHFIPYRCSHYHGISSFSLLNNWKDIEDFLSPRPQLTFRPSHLTSCLPHLFL